MLKIGLWALVWLGTPAQAHAVRPFVTDDARIIDFGQIEIETWLETIRADGEWNPAPGFNMIGGMGLPTGWKCLREAGLAAIPATRRPLNPILMTKFLLKPAEVGGS